MEAVTQYADRKAELEERIKSLETEKTVLHSDIVSLKGRIAELELEKQVDALKSEVDALRTEKAVLEERTATYETPTGYEVPRGTADGLSLS